MLMLIGIFHKIAALFLPSILHIFLHFSRLNLASGSAFGLLFAES